MLAAKNIPLTGAATDLGLGTMLQQEVEAQEIERKKKLSSAQPQQSLFSAAANQLLGTTHGSMSGG